MPDCRPFYTLRSHALLVPHLSNLFCLALLNTDICTDGCALYQYVEVGARYLQSNGVRERQTGEYLSMTQGHQDESFSMGGRFSTDAGMHGDGGGSFAVLPLVPDGCFSGVCPVSFWPLSLFDKKKEAAGAALYPGSRQRL